MTAPPKLKPRTVGNRYLILYFDVLGFSARVDEIGLPAILEQYERMTDMIRSRRGSQLVLGEDGGVPATFVMSWYSTYFSDSILVWTEYPTPAVLDPAIAMARRLFCDCLANGLPVRGAIAAGDAVMDIERGIYLGQPIIDAVRAESAQRSAGIGVASSWPRLFGGALGRSDVFLPFEQHVKPGKEDLLCKVALDWPRLWRDSDEFSGLPLDDIIDGYTRPGFEHYWDATRQVVRHSAATPRWWEAYDFENESPGPQQQGPGEALGPR